MINRIFFAVVGLIVMVYVYKKVSKNKIAEKESLFWMLGAIGVFILSIIPNTIQIIARLLGIEYAPSMLFMIGIIFCLILIFRLTVCIFSLQQQVKELGQRNAIMQKTLEEIQKVEKRLSWCIN
ncbi:MAG: DUF2304 domain-containing protein [Peptostreptococcaceae bacterium]|nr:DUF2304 domain-containing protein [Peptostreptococcaceae bacterium]